VIFHICPRAEWEEAQRAGRYVGSAASLRDGFLHFSTASQIVESAAKHWAGKEDLILLAADEAALGGSVKWEKSRGGALFPHVYGPIPLTAVTWSKRLPLGADGRHAFPPL